MPGTSNWSGDYFISTAGLGVVIQSDNTMQVSKIVTDLNEKIFMRDRNSQYATPIDNFSLTGTPIQPTVAFWCFIIFPFSTSLYSLIILLNFAISIDVRCSDSALYHILAHFYPSSSLYWSYSKITKIEVLIRWEALEALVAKLFFSFLLFFYMLASFASLNTQHDEQHNWEEVCCETQLQWMSMKRALIGCIQCGKLPHRLFRVFMCASISLL